MDNDVQRREWITDRIEALRDELEELIRELEAMKSGTPERARKRRKLTLIRGGARTRPLALAGMAYLASRYRRALIAVATTAAGTSMAAIAVFSHDAPDATRVPLESPITHTVASGGVPPGPGHPAPPTPASMTGRTPTPSVTTVRSRSDSPRPSGAASFARPAHSPIVPLPTLPAVSVSVSLMPTLPTPVPLPLPSCVVSALIGLKICG